MDEELKKVIEFHGHFCPGLAIGYRVAKYVKNHFKKSEDEELVAIVENNACGVDAIQYMLSCTFGKGNLIFKDNGKHVYTFYSRESNRAIRIYVKKNFFEEFDDILRKFNTGKLSEEEMQIFNQRRKEISEKILSMDEKELFDVREVDIEPPRKARLFPSIKCQECGEYFMEIKGRVINGKIVCKECFEKLLKN
ncbi:FmdE family protein [Methanotorris igneus]|uniref:Formylmethanofuran dehydrogenase subunit E region n=1 Tax=Methanotorris igneus (strain DSM 5666 / JCM 11834 / Kol 5) TaxID=880724 RepID=F6BAN5_METIK|nr:FmdE family protein [Methanotorris igneus]AEF95849.1 formylmethanofuran dehydrogenase subunit E region [Methanotorris igneus Kol 5]